MTSIAFHRSSPDRFPDRPTTRARCIQLLIISLFFFLIYLFICIYIYFIWSIRYPRLFLQVLFFYFGFFFRCSSHLQVKPKKVTAISPPFLDWFNRFIIKIFLLFFLNEFDLIEFIVDGSTSLSRWLFFRFKVSLVGFIWLFMCLNLV